MGAVEKCMKREKGKERGGRERGKERGAREDKRKRRL